MRKSEHVFIIGAGAIGKSLAVFLQTSGAGVTLIRGSADNIDDHVQHLEVESDGVTHRAAIRVSTLNAFEKLDGVVVLTNKSYGNEELAEKLESKIGESPIVLLQNGLGVEKHFLKRQFNGVYRCVLFVTAQAITETLLRFKPVSICPVGIEKGNFQELSGIVESLDNPFFRFRMEEEIQKIIWKKAIVNCVFNSVCPLLEVDNGIFQRDAGILKIGQRIIDECVSIANKRGIPIQNEEVEVSLLQISKSSAGQLISTYQDILQGRKTEIDTLNVEIVRMAKELGLENTVKETGLLGELIKLKAGMKRGQNFAA